MKFLSNKGTLKRASEMMMQKYKYSLTLQIILRTLKSKIGTIPSHSGDTTCMNYIYMYMCVSERL